MSCSFVFFFKQKTAYEMLRSLVGSEMCIRDSSTGMAVAKFTLAVDRGIYGEKKQEAINQGKPTAAVSYTHLTLPTIYSV